MAESEQSTAPDLGGLSIEDNTRPGGAAPAQDVPRGTSASAGIVEGRRKRSDAGVSRGTRTGKSAPSVPAIPESAFLKIYDPKIWGRALAAPGDTLAAITGKKLWEISDEEKEHLGATGSLAAQVYAMSDPRGLALALAAITVLDVYLTRLMFDLAERREARKQAAEKAKTA